jgi:hypothetical protein
MVCGVVLTVLCFLDVSYGVMLAKSRVMFVDKLCCVLRVITLSV